MKLECPKRLIRCVECGDNFQAAEHDEHRNNHCPERNIMCKYCGESIKSKGMRKHEDVDCPFSLIKCQNKRQGCTWKGSRKEMANHLASVCSHSFRVKCPNGCGRILRKVDFVTHTRKECSRREIWCSKCNDFVLANLEEMHKKYECPNKNK